MSTSIIVYDAKCKHCLHFKYKRLIKKDGTLSKKSQASCFNVESEHYNERLTLKTKACNKLEL